MIVERKRTLVGDRVSSKASELYVTVHKGGCEYCVVDVTGDGL